MQDTNMIKQTFDYFLDLSTSSDKASIVKIKAGGSYVKTRLLPFFTAFKYYKLGAVKINMVPAATLPVDPTGLSYEAGEQTVDPRDMFNPGLVRITNGEDMCPDNADISQEAYTSLITDHRWFKFRLNSGFERKAVPLYWEIGQLHQDATPGQTRNVVVPDLYGAPPLVHAVTETPLSVGEEGDPSFNYFADKKEFSDPRGFFQMGQKERVGWMPTDMSEDYDLVAIDEKTKQTVVQRFNRHGIAPVPEIELLTMILPKAYKTKYFYRLYISESVYFKDPVSNFTPFDVGLSNYPRNTIDRGIEPNINQFEMDGQFNISGIRPSPVPNQAQGNTSGELK